MGTEGNSPAQLLRHLKTHHDIGPPHKPDVNSKRDAINYIDPTSEEEEETDTQEITSRACDIARHLIGRDLQSFAVSERPGFKAYMRSCGVKTILPGHSSVRKAFNRLYEDGKNNVRRQIATAKAQKLRMAITGDSWKCKRKGRLYRCTTAEWVDQDWKLQETY